MDNNEEYWLWLCSHKELYRTHIDGVMQCFDSPRELFYAPAAAIEENMILNDLQKQALLRSRDCWDYQKYTHQLELKGIRFISSEHQEYPVRLREIIDYPYGLFFKGALPDPAIPAVGIVGSRRCSSYGKKMAEKFAAEFAFAGITVISGMAAGIDGFAQNAALEAGGRSFGVLGSGADVCYPRQNKTLYDRLCSSGGIITEYPPGREPLALHFPIRNRLISGLSDMLLVIEAKERSGSLITADLALEQGRDVYAVPGRLEDTFNAGGNRLISQGAGIILSSRELIEALKPDFKIIKKNKKNTILLERREKLVYSCLDFTPKSIEDIIRHTRLAVQEVMAALTMLEVKGIIEEPTKNYYAKAN